jgi:hypothetical protein
MSKTNQTKNEERVSVDVHTTVDKGPKQDVGEPEIEINAICAL